MKLLKKIQSQPENIKKIILWAVIIPFAVIILVIWVKDIQNKVNNFDVSSLKNQLQIPALEEDLSNLPKLEMPKVSLPEIPLSEEELKQLEELENSGQLDNLDQLEQLELVPQEQPF